jgi:hypothetical protein
MYGGKHMPDQMDLFAPATKSGTGRPRKTGRCIRFYVAGYLHPDEDEDDRKLLEWIQGLPEGTRFANVRARLLSGGGVEGQARTDGEAEALAAADEIINNFVV